MLRVSQYGPYLEGLRRRARREQRHAAHVGPRGWPRQAGRWRRPAAPRRGRSDQVLTRPVTGTPIVARNSRYGPYVTDPSRDQDRHGPCQQPRSSADRPRATDRIAASSMHFRSVTLDDTLTLLSLPHVVSIDECTQITTQNSRYRPSEEGTDSRTLASEEPPSRTTLEALAILRAAQRRTAPRPRPRGCAAGDDP